MAKEPMHNLCGLARIRSAYPSLTPTEKRVADYCMKRPEEIIYLSVTQLSERCGVGESTIIRFSQAAGFSGYHDLKLNLALELSARSQHPARETLDPESSTAALVERVTAMNMGAIQDTSKLVDAENLAQAVEKILEAKRLFFFGVGTSGITAADAQSKFLRIGFLAYAPADSHQQIMSAAHVGPGDVCVAFSHSGSTKDTVDTMRLAKANGACTITITDAVKAPMIELSDLVLLTGSAEDPLQGGSLRSKLAQVHMIDLLYTGVAHRLGQEVVELKKKSALSVVDKLY
ncbi:MurR/RpiR family transcriptional regulator [Candidatus Darwinibacter acetoxidans]